MENLQLNLSFSLIVCTYSRPDSVIRLMDSVAKQSLYPDEILIIDSSEDDKTEKLLLVKNYKCLIYHRVGETNKGLTKQRNFGIGKVKKSSEVVCFLDDDILLEEDYFEKLIGTYKLYPKAVGVGGTILEKDTWKKVPDDYQPEFDEFARDGYVRKLGSRNILRKRLGLLSNLPPGYMPEFSHGLSTGFLPPSGKIYPVEFFMGGVSSFRRSLFKKVNFSHYFVGYGLYEDMDFCLRASRQGDLYVNTSAGVYHLHDESGRPDYFKYGEMVVRNGYYVWNLKYPKPRLNAVFKWNLITLLLLVIRFKNDILDKEKGARKDAYGRLRTWMSLPFQKS